MRSSAFYLQITLTLYINCTQTPCCSCLSIKHHHFLSLPLTHKCINTLKPPTNSSSGCSSESSSGLVGFPLSAPSFMWLLCHQEQEVRVSWVTVQTHTVNYFLNALPLRFAFLVKVEGCHTRLGRRVTWRFALYLLWFNVSIYVPTSEVKVIS